MNTLQAISALPIGAFFPKGRLPLHYDTQGRPVITLNGVEHVVDEPEVLSAPVRAYLAALQEPRHDR